MEKLELKHLSGYLPYGLKITKYSKIYPDPKITGFLSNGTLYWNYHGATGGWNINNVKPILRQLSDLTKEIEVNGEKLIPIDYINKEYNWDYVKNNIRDIVIENDYSLIEFLPKIVVNKLEEWHFDIHGLIEKGLAIDINTLK